MLIMARRNRQFIEENFAAATHAVCARLDTTHSEELRDVSPEQREKITQAVFDRMHEWTVNHLPMGAPAHISEEFLRKGLHAAQQQVKAAPPAGCDPITVLTVISCLFSIIGWLKRWFSGEES